MGNPYTFPLTQGGGFLGGGSDDYSTYANFIPIMPFPFIGKHEFDCFAKASSNAFDGSPVTTETVSAPFTGKILSGPAPERTRHEDLPSTLRVLTLLINSMLAHGRRESVMCPQKQ